ncbi:MAG: HD domain-containing protein [Rudaea sp.]|uniref:HD domain-containing protein n=1 Tax=Rudaea sp. TaxID=2136325 RepID=UPI0010F71F79|nr:HD domain-containing protein [Rudaea sp.]MBN8884604.1 HD domain-containing protein [Rudaea sp.]
MATVTTITAAALKFASQKHAGQTRKDAAATPYITHPIAVRDLLVEHGVTDSDVLCAALLHDTVEDTQTTAAELSTLFGSRVAELVLAVTDDKSLPKAERKRLQVEHAPQLPAGAKLVKLADKICNVRDVIDNPPPWPTERKREYLQLAARVAGGLRGTNARLEQTLRDEIVRGLSTLTAST